MIAVKIKYHCKRLYLRFGHDIPTVHQGKIRSSFTFSFGAGAQSVYQKRAKNVGGQFIIDALMIIILKKKMTRFYLMVVSIQNRVKE